MEVARLQVAFEATGQPAVQRAVRQTDHDITQLADHSEQAGRRMGNAFDGAGRAIKVAFGAVAAIGAGKAALGFLNINAQAEQLKVQLDIATGSAERAQKVFGELQAMAAETPFEFPELVSASARIEAFGIDSLKAMQVIGDTAAGTGKSIDQVTNAYLDAGMGQFIRLQELGIDAAVEGDKVKFKWIENGKEITKEVDKNSTAQIQSTLEAIWNKKYEGAMKKQSKTFNGQLSTLKDNWNLTMGRLTMGFFDFTKGVLGEANEFFNLFNRKLDQGLDPVHAALSALHVTLDQVFGKQAGDAIDATLRGIVDGISAVTGAIGTAIDVLGAMGDALLIDIQTGNWEALFTDVRDDIVFLATTAWDNIVVPLANWTLDVAAPSVIGWLASVAGNIAGWLKTWLFGGKPVGDGTDQGAATPGVIAEFGAWTLNVAEPTIAGWLKDTAGDVWTGLKDAAGWGVDAAASLGAWSLDTATPSVTGWIADYADDMWGGIKVAAHWVFAGGEIAAGWTLNVAAPTVKGWIADISGDVWSGLTSAAGWAWAGAADIGMWTLYSATPMLTGWIKDTAEDVWGGLKSVAGWALDKAAELGAWTLNAGIPAVTGWLSDNKDDVWAGLKAAVGWTWDNIADLGTITFNALADLGGDLRAIKDDAGKWIREALNWTGDKTIQVGKVILQGDVQVEDTGGASPEEEGRTWVDKFLSGVRSTADAIRSTSLFVISTITSGLGYATGAGIAIAIGGVIKGIAAFLSDPGGAYMALVGAISASFNFVLARLGELFDATIGRFWTSFVSGIQDVVGKDWSLDIPTPNINGDWFVIGPDNPLVGKIGELLDGIGDIPVTFPGNITMTIGTPDLPDINFNSVFNWLWNKLKSIGDISVPWPNSWTMNLPTPNLPDISFDNVFNWLWNKLSSIGDISVPFPGSININFPNIFPQVPIPGRARGGAVREPVTLVGERGPELVSLPRGSYVHTAAQTAAMARGSRFGRGGGGGGDTYYLVDLSNAIVGRGAMQEIQAMIAEGSVKTYDSRSSSSRLASR